MGWPLSFPGGLDETSMVSLYRVISQLDFSVKGNRHPFSSGTACSQFKSNANNGYTELLIAQHIQSI
jgi:hypothetical protein